MKLFGRKYGKSTFVLLIGSAIIGLCLFMVLFNIKRKEQLELNSRGFYNEYAQEFMLTEAASEERFLKAMQASVQDGIVYLMHLDYANTLQGVWYQGEIKKPELESGRFFVEEDFSSGKRVAVIGKKYLKELEKKDGKSYLEIGEESYEVIGILAAQEDTRMGQLKFINWDAAIKTYGLAGDYLLDGLNKSKVKEEIDQLAERMYSDEFYHSDLEVDDDSVVRVFGLETLDAIYMVMVVNFIICGIFITVYWLYKKKSYIEVYTLLGFTRRRIFLDLLKNYMISVALGFLISFTYLFIKGGMS